MIDAPIIRRAGAVDAAALATILDTALRNDPISAWLLPRRADRDRLHLAWMRRHVDEALRDGLVWTTTDLEAATLWYDVPAEPLTYDPDEELRARLAATLGAHHAQRIATFEQLVIAAHPQDQPHAYLAFIAVAPHRQGGGVGSHLLRRRLSELDTAGVPAYLEASNGRNAQLYQRLGFRACRAPIELPEGPALLPMWRSAAG